MVVGDRWYIMWLRSASILAILSLALGQRIFDISGIDANCMPPGDSVSFNVFDPAIAQTNNGEWWKATVVAINRDTPTRANLSASSVVPKSYRIRWCSGIPSGSSSEVNVTVTQLRKNDIVDCFAQRGACKAYNAGDRGTFCACAWTQDGGSVCAKGANWDSDELSQVSCSSAALKSASEAMIAQQMKPVTSCSQLVQKSCISNAIDLSPLVSPPLTKS
jgi:hypothetical protein